MAVITQLTADQKSRSLVLRVNRQTRSATYEGTSSVFYGDTLVVIVDSISGVDPAALQLILWKKEAGQTISSALAYVDGFAATQGSSSRAMAEIPFTSTNLRDALVATPIGTPLTCRLVLREGPMVVVDSDCSVYPNPDITVAPPVDPEEDVSLNPFLRQDHFRAWALSQLAVPLDTQDDMAAMITTILTKLSSPTT